MGVSNNFTSAINFLALVCSIPIIGAGIWLAKRTEAECLPHARWPIVILGTFLLLTSLVGVVGAVWDYPCLLASYIFAMAALIFVLIALILFSAFIVFRSDESYHSFAAAEYSGWLQDYVARHWTEIRQCIATSTLCGQIGGANAFLTVDQYFRTDFSPLQSGCCKPPPACGYVYVNPTIWINPSNPGADPDCYAWSVDQTQLCLGCSSCKAGMLGGLRHEWRMVNAFLVAAAVALIVLYILSCCAFNNAKKHDHVIFRR